MRVQEVAAIVLAAGRGSRFAAAAGADAVKLLAPLDGRPVLQHVLDTVAAVGPTATIVVLGHSASRVGAAISWRAERRVLNPDPDRGLSSSVRLGIDALAEDPVGAGIAAALILLGDQPLVDRAAIEALLDAADDSAEPFLVPRYADGSSLNPVLVKRSAWPLACTLEGDRGFGQLFAERPDLLQTVDLPGSNPDIDKPSDLVHG